VKVFKDYADAETCDFSSQECHENQYAVYCVTNDRGYNNIKEYVNQCIWEARTDAASKHVALDYDALALIAEEGWFDASLVVIFTDNDGYEWWDDESNNGRIYWSDYHLSYLIACCLDDDLPSSFGETERVVNLRPFEKGDTVQDAGRTDESSDIPF